MYEKFEKKILKKIFNFIYHYFYQDHQDFRDFGITENITNTVQ